MTAIKRDCRRNRRFRVRIHGPPIVEHFVVTLPKIERKRFYPRRHHRMAGK